MTLHIDNPQLEERLAEQARAEGLSPDAYAERVLVREIATKPQDPLRSSASLLGALAPYGPAPSAEEIDENRREMFQNFAREDQW